VDDLIINIQKRGREIEMSVRPEYLQSLQDSYFSYFKTEKDIPILILEITGTDFCEDRKLYKKITGLLRRSYSKGVYRATVK